jgi:hypothetical protein
MQKIIKPNLGKHFGKIKNSKTFEKACFFILNNSDKIYATTGNDTPFTAKVSVTTRGKHKGTPVIRFFTEGIEKARAYECCWNHKTNCNKTHIDCYSKAI